MSISSLDRVEWNLSPTITLTVGFEIICVIIFLFWCMNSMNCGAILL
jgi:hypothetical protein